MIHKNYGPVVSVGIRPRYTHWNTLPYWEVCRPSQALSLSSFPNGKELGLPLQLWRRASSRYVRCKGGVRGNTSWLHSLEHPALLGGVSPHFWLSIRTTTWQKCEEQLLRRNVKRFRGGLVFKARRLVYHSTLGWRVIKKKISPHHCSCGACTIHYPLWRVQSAAWSTTVDSG